MFGLFGPPLGVGVHDGDGDRVPPWDAATRRHTASEPATIPIVRRRPRTRPRVVAGCTAAPSRPDAVVGLQALAGVDVLQEPLLPVVARIQEPLVHPVGALLDGI